MPYTPTAAQIDTVTRHYLLAMLWADSPEGTRPRVTVSAGAAALERCQAFITEHADLFGRAMDCAERGYGTHPDAGSAEAAFGHDLYLSTAGHGAGFFNRTELPEDLRDALQEAARRAPSPEPEFYRGWAYLRPLEPPRTTPTKPQAAIAAALRLAIIPFSGFYESVHDQALDDACESILQDDSGDCVHDALPMRLFDAVDWGLAHQAYARRYAADWCDRLGIKGAEFEELNSPREYNFTTDRIFVRIPDAEVARIHRETKPDELARVAREWFTSRSGFISFYSPDVSTWGPIGGWDHNKVGALLQAWQNQTKPDLDDWGIVEDWSGNALVEDMVLNTPAAVHVAGLAYRIRRMRGEC